MARKVCPECKTGDLLYSVETMTSHFPVTVDDDGMDYTGGGSVDFDETAAPTGDIWCDECQWEGPMSHLIDAPELGA